MTFGFEIKAETLKACGNVNKTVKTPGRMLTHTQCKAHNTVIRRDQLGQEQVKLVQNVCNANGHWQDHNSIILYYTNAVIY